MSSQPDETTSDNTLIQNPSDMASKDEKETVISSEENPVVDTRNEIPMNLLPAGISSYFESLIEY